MDPPIFSGHVEQVLQKPIDRQTVHRLRQRRRTKDRTQESTPCQAFRKEKLRVKQFERFCLTRDYLAEMPSAVENSNTSKVEDGGSVHILKLSALQKFKFLPSPTIPMTIKLIPHFSDDCFPSPPLGDQQFELIYHYNTVACSNLSSSHTPQSKRLWAVATPRMAFQSPVVLQSLLALSALHLSQLHPSDRTLPQISLKHFINAISLQRSTLCLLNSTNAEPVLAASVLLGTYTWLARHIKDSKDGEETYEIPLHTYRMIKGVETLSSQVAPLLLFKSPIEWYNNTSASIEVVLPSPTPEEHITPWLNPANDNVSWSDTPPPSPSTTLLPLSPHKPTPRQLFFHEAQDDLSCIFTAFTDAPLSPQEAFIYRLGLVELSTLHTIIASSSQPPITELHRRTLNFALRLPKEFLEYLKTKKPIAMALLARSWALMSVVGGEDAWWVFGASGKDGYVPAREVRGLASLMGKEWKWVMEWPLRVVNGEMGFDC